MSGAFRVVFGLSKVFDSVEFGYPQVCSIFSVDGEGRNGSRVVSKNEGSYGKFFVYFLVVLVCVWNAIPPGTQHF